MNITDKSAIRECTNCQMCAAVCPKDVIKIHLNVNKKNVEWLLVKQLHV